MLLIRKTELAVGRASKKLISTSLRFHTFAASNWKCYAVCTASQLLTFLQRALVLAVQDKLTREAHQFKVM